MFLRIGRRVEVDRAGAVHVVERERPAVEIPRAAAARISRFPRLLPRRELARHLAVRIGFLARQALRQVIVIRDDPPQRILHDRRLRLHLEVVQ